MKKTNNQYIVQQWLDDVYISKTIEYRQFYNTESLYNLYKSSLYYQKPKSTAKKIYLLRSFTGTLNNIIAMKTIPTFKSKHVKRQGYLYMFVYPHEKHKSLKSTRFSKRNNDFPTTASTEQTESSNTPPTLPTNEPSSGPSLTPLTNYNDAPSDASINEPSNGPSLTPLIIMPSDGPSITPLTSLPSDGPSITPITPLTSLPSDGPSSTPTTPSDSTPSDGPSLTPSTIPFIIPTTNVSTNNLLNSNTNTPLTSGSTNSPFISNNTIPPLTSVATNSTLISNTNIPWTNVSSNGTLISNTIPSLTNITIPPSTNVPINGTFISNTISPSTNVPTNSSFINNTITPSTNLPTNDNTNLLPTSLSSIVGTKFNSIGALNFFMDRKRASKVVADASITDYETYVRSHISDQIELLQNANIYAEGWGSIINDKDKGNCCS